jgi:hypothetical protein
MYAYQPSVRLHSRSGRLFLEVPGMGNPIEVVTVSVVEDGTIVSDFNGYSGDSEFQFENGNVWKQSEYKYNYHYAYRPNAIVVDGVNGLQVHIEGMEEPVAVRRVR